MTASADFSAYVRYTPSLSCQDSSLADSRPPCSKVWDTTTGECLVTLPHAHIVRTADISSGLSSSQSAPTSSPRPRVSSLRVLTGGHEKHLRMWDLSRVAGTEGGEAGTNEGVDECRRGAERDQPAHDGTIKKVLFDEARQCCVSMGEDRRIR